MIEIDAAGRTPLGMSPTRFLRDYWQKRPLLIRNAFPDFVAPITADELAGLACEETALSRIVLYDAGTKPPDSGSGVRAAHGSGTTTATVRASFPRRRKSIPGTAVNSRFRRSDATGNARRRPDPRRWILRNGPFAESDFAKLPRTDWTLLVQDVDKWDADVAALLDRFAFLPDWRIDDVMVSYAADGGSVGAHVDQYDVFLLQGPGRRRWRIDARFPRGSPYSPVQAPRFPPDAFRDDSELKLLREFAPTHDWLLESGDMLYLPPGVPHHGIAEGDCLTFSIGMRAPAAAELIVDFADFLAESLVEEDRYCDPDLRQTRRPGEIDAAAMNRVESATAQLRSANAATLRRWFGRFITRYRSAQVGAPNPRPLTDAAFSRALAQGTRAKRNPWSRFAWTREGRGATLYAAGENHACSQHFAQRVCTEADFPLAAVATPDHAVLRALIDGGHLALLRPRRLRRSA